MIEIVKENPRYFSFVKSKCVCTVLNLLEFYYSARVSLGETRAKAMYSHFKTGLVQFDDETVFDAMEFRQHNKRLNLSYADALGYTIAKHLGIPFLTGDESFKALPNVIFIKK